MVRFLHGLSSMPTTFWPDIFSRPMVTLSFAHFIESYTDIRLLYLRTVPFLSQRYLSLQRLMELHNLELDRVLLFYIVKFNWTRRALK